MGATYKANCNDLRNSKSLKFSNFKKKNCEVHILIQMLIKKMLVKLNFVKLKKFL